MTGENTRRDKARHFPIKKRIRGGRQTASDSVFSQWNLTMSVGATDRLFLQCFGRFHREKSKKDDDDFSLFGFYVPAAHFVRLPFHSSSSNYNFHYMKRKGKNKTFYKRYGFFSK
jgi:hypothetical protein